MITKTNSSIFRVCLVIVLLAMLIFSFVVGWSYRQVQQKALSDANEKARLNLNEAREIVDKYLKQVEVAGYSLASIALQAKSIDTNDVSYLYFTLDKDHMLDENATFDILEQFLEANPHLWGAAIGFEPNLFPKYGEDGFAPFVRHADSSYMHYVLSREKNNYRVDDWYKETKRLDYPRWSEPFMDIRGAIISCFCIPIHDKSGEYIGTIAVDLQLDRFGDDLLREIRAFENSNLMLLDGKQTFLVHSNHEMIMSRMNLSYENWADSAEQNKSRLYYTPINSTNWTVALECSEDDIFADTNVLMRKIFRLCLMGILIVLISAAFLIFQIRNVIVKQAGMESELNIASLIQLGILPRDFPKNDKVELNAFLHPAKEVGGDLYDFFIDGDTLHFAIGDVSGKGVPASLVMAITKSALRLSEGMNLSVAEVMSKINNHIESGNINSMFVTMFIGRLNLKTGELTYCNAGHNPLVIAEKGKLARFLDTKPNLAVGLFADFPFEMQTIQLTEGTHLVLYTDGVTEAETVDKQFYGEGRLLTCVDKSILESSNVAQAVMNDVKLFVKNNEQNDDITIMSIHYL